MIKPDKNRLEAGSSYGPGSAAASTKCASVLDRIHDCMYICDRGLAPVLAAPSRS